MLMEGSPVYASVAPSFAAAFPGIGIDALQDAKNKAPLEITTLELSQGDTHWMPFTNFSDADLYRKLSQYQQGLEAYCIEKRGKQLFDELMKK